MKTFVAFIAIIGLSICVHADLTDEQKQKLLADGKKCIAETGIDVEVVKKAREGNFSDDPKLKPFTGCMARAIGFQDASGKTQVEVIRQKLSAALNDPAAADKLIETCLHEKPTPDETAFETFECYQTNTPTHLSVF